MVRIHPPPPWIQKTSFNRPERYRLAFADPSAAYVASLLAGPSSFKSSRGASPAETGRGQPADQRHEPRASAPAAGRTDRQPFAGWSGTLRQTGQRTIVLAAIDFPTGRFRRFCRLGQLDFSRRWARRQLGGSGLELQHSLTQISPRQQFCRQGCAAIQDLTPISGAVHCWPIQ